MALELNSEQVKLMGAMASKIAKEVPNNSWWAEFLGNLPASIANVKEIVKDYKEMQQMQMANKPQQQAPPQNYNFLQASPDIPQMVTPSQKADSPLVSSQSNINEPLKSADTQALTQDKIREVINYELNNMLIEVEKNKAVIESLNGYQLIQMLLAQKEMIVNGIVERLYNGI